MVARSADPTSSDVAARTREPSKVQVARERLAQGNFIVPSIAERTAAKTERGGWTALQLAQWGVPWPAPDGWKDELLRRYDAGERISNEPLPDRIQPKRSGHCAICDTQHVFIAIMRNDNPDIARAILCSPECYRRWVEQNDPSC